MKISDASYSGKICSINQNLIVFSVSRLSFSLGICMSVHTLLMACDVFLITLKNDGGRLHSSVSLTMAPLAAETYITLIGSNGSNICHHVAFMDQQRRLLKINIRTARRDRRVLHSISSPMTLAFQC